MLLPPRQARFACLNALDSARKRNERVAPFNPRRKNRARIAPPKRLDGRRHQHALELRKRRARDNVPRSSEQRRRPARAPSVAVADLVVVLDVGHRPRRLPARRRGDHPLLQTLADCLPEMKVLRRRVARAEGVCEVRAGELEEAGHLERTPAAADAETVAVFADFLVEGAAGVGQDEAGAFRGEGGQGLAGCRTGNGRRAGRRRALDGRLGCGFRAAGDAERARAFPGESAARTVARPHAQTGPARACVDPARLRAAADAGAAGAFSSQGADGAGVCGCVDADARDAVAVRPRSCLTHRWAKGGFIVGGH